MCRGAYSILTGVAANESMATGQPIEIGKLVNGLSTPSFPEMPDGQERVEYVTNVEQT